MKKLAILCAMIMALCSFTACGAVGEAATAGSDEKKLSVVTTVFPVYDWTKNILGDKAEDTNLVMLLDNGVDLHSFQPTADDIKNISTCDVFIYVGGESDKWVDDALKEASNKDMVVINLMDVLGDKAVEEEIIEGMEGEEEEEEEEGEEEEGPEYDEHVWLSLKNASVLCEAIEEGLAKADADNADSYKTNLDGYVEKLGDLDKQYETAVKEGSCDTLLFGDRFPFRYMIEDYGLNYYAAFIGCSAETEASFETINFLAKKVDELSLKNVMIIEGSDGKIADTIVKNTETKDQKILELNSMQSCTKKDVEEGASYLSIMEKNLEVLKEALK